MRSIETYLEYVNKQQHVNAKKDAELQKVVDQLIEEQYIKVNESRGKEQEKTAKLLVVRKSVFHKFYLYLLQKVKPFISLSFNVESNRM